MHVQCEIRKRGHLFEALQPCDARMLIGGLHCTNRVGRHVHVKIFLCGKIPASFVVLSNFDTN